jgi:hypothetical protein
LQQLGLKVTKIRLELAGAASVGGLHLMSPCPSWDLSTTPLSTVSTRCRRRHSYVAYWPVPTKSSDGLHVGCPGYTGPSGALGKSTQVTPRRTHAAHQVFAIRSRRRCNSYTEIYFDVGRAVRAYRSWFHCLTRLVTAPPVAVRPPSTTNCPPVVLEARSEQRKSTMLAISSTVV